MLWQVLPGACFPAARAERDLAVLAVTTAQRLPYLPDVPTIAELGFPDYEITSWQGVFVPAGTPSDVVAKLNLELVQMLKTPEVRMIAVKLVEERADPVGSSQVEFAAAHQARTGKMGERWRRPPA